MKILHVNCSTKGGAGIGVARLQEALLEEKLNSFVLNYESYVENYSGWGALKQLIRFNWWIKILFKKILIKFFIKLPNKEALSFNIFNNFNLQKLIKKKKFDLVHLHWIGNEMISIKEISSIKIPIIWTMHDMWPFCGGEHFTIDTRYEKNYSDVSRSKLESGIDLNKILWENKNKYLKNKNIHVVCPSKWMQEKVKKSSLFQNNPTHVLPYIINTKKWDIDSKLNNKIINSNNKTVILFSATSSVNYRKGFNFLAEAINNYLDTEKYYLLVMGDKPKKFDNIKIEKKFIGLINSEETIKSIYNSSDIFVMPSLFESFGQVFSEAGCFGIPSVAFKNTAASEIIEHKYNGYLAEYKSSIDLAEGINWVNSELKNNNLFKNIIRKKIVDNFSYEKKTKDYLDLYKKILEEDFK
jgi:glycosyltransferase involved in cell wall biosynthesis